MSVALACFIVLLIIKTALSVAHNLSLIARVNNTSDCLNKIKALRTILKLLFQSKRCLILSVRPFAAFRLILSENAKNGETVYLRGLYERRSCGNDGLTLCKIDPNE